MILTKTPNVSNCCKKPLLRQTINNEIKYICSECGKSYANYENKMITTYNSKGLNGQ